MLCDQAGILKFLYEEDVIKVVLNKQILLKYLQFTVIIIIKLRNTKVKSRNNRCNIIILIYHKIVTYILDTDCFKTYLRDKNIWKGTN